MIPIKGNFFDGSTSNRRSAAFSVNDAGQFFINALENQSNSMLYCGDISQLDVSPRLGNTPRYLYIKNGANFETNDNDGIDILFKQYCRNQTPPFPSYTRKPPSNSPCIYCTCFGFYVGRNQLWNSFYG